MNGKIAVVSPPQLNVIVQAGGRGSRLRHHTWNKPKCLVSVNGKPLLYHLFDRFSGARFSVIGDYAFEQLEKYLEINPPQVELSLIRAAERGTCSGINEALSQIPVDAPLLLVWGDLMIDAMPALPNLDCPVVCTTSAFTCRWTAPESGGLQEVPGNKSGIPGIFYFSQSGIVPRPPEAGEFVRWFSSEVSRFVTLDCPDLQELGDLESLERSNDRAGFSRYFNKVTIREEEVQKEAIDPFYAHLIDKEKAWYRELGALGFRRIPDVRSEKPFVLERIKGDHPYTMLDLSQREQRAVVADCLDTLIALHDLSKAPVVEEDVTDVYVTKTLSRVESISAIIPGFDRPSVTINGRKCQNIFSGSASDTLFD
ncbi:MAG: NTP transferase domain-containing protein, partial [Rhodospirillales bacterium]